MLATAGALSFRIGTRDGCWRHGPADDVRIGARPGARAGRDRVPRRRRPRDGRVARAAPGAAAAPRGRAGHRQDRARRGARRVAGPAADPPAVLRGHRRDARRSTTGTSRARSCTCGPSRRSKGAARDVREVEDGLFDERFLLARPVLRALREAPAVLLVDEIDRADDEFEAFLLEVLSTWQVTIPELGTVTAAAPPVVVLTSNRTRELHDALKRRCLYHWLEHPGLERELAIVARPRARGLRGARRAGGLASSSGSGPTARPAQAAGGRRDARLGPGPARARHPRARHSRRRRPPWGWR